MNRNATAFLESKIDDVFQQIAAGTRMKDLAETLGVGLSTLERFVSKHAKRKRRKQPNKAEARVMDPVETAAMEQARLTLIYFHAPLNQLRAAA